MMDELLGLPDLSLRDRLMLHIMAETGLRLRAVSWLSVDTGWSRSSLKLSRTGCAYV